MLNLKIFLTICAITWFIYQLISVYKFAAKLAAFSKVIAGERKSHVFLFEIYNHIAEYRYAAFMAFGLTGLFLVALALLNINYEYFTAGILALIISFFANSIFEYEWSKIREEVRGILSESEFREIDQSTDYKTTDETSLEPLTIFMIGFLPTSFFLFAIWY